MPEYALPVSTPFQQRLSHYDLQLTRRPITTLQLNIGKLCNQACLHCHVEAGPNRTELMTRDTMQRILALVEASPEVRVIDITGGAPELNPDFRFLVKALHRLGRQVIDRCNLTVLFEAGQEDTAEFLADHQVKVVASLPCYSKENVDRQRGQGVFDKSIRALQRLNELGYGEVGSGLVLDLVYNPVGPSLPPKQQELEAAYKQELCELFGIQFNQLYTITNMPIKRFLTDLERQQGLTGYMDLLCENFNPTAAMGVMCRDLISIGWDGKIYDCDFNQMLELPLAHQEHTVWGVENLQSLLSKSIAFDDHCYGCTAGAGSSCSGELLAADSLY